MLNLCRTLQSLFLFFGASYISVCDAELNKKYEKVIDKNILGQEIATLYDKFGYLKLEVDNEYADLDRLERYWLAIDSHYEFLTLRTINDLVVEVIIRNPDIKTERGITVGKKLDEFIKSYPDANKLNTYTSGIKRQLIAYCVESEKLEVEFYEGKIFVLKILDECH